jgi:hypothetical protein
MFLLRPGVGHALGLLGVSHGKIQNDKLTTGTLKRGSSCCESSTSRLPSGRFRLGLGLSV